MEFPRQAAKILAGLKNEDVLVREQTAMDALDMATADIYRLSLVTNSPKKPNAVGAAQKTSNWLLDFIGKELVSNVKEIREPSQEIINSAVDRLMDIKNNRQLPQTLRDSADAHLNDVRKYRGPHEVFRTKFESDGQSFILGDHSTKPMAKIKSFLTCTTHTHTEIEKLRQFAKTYDGRKSLSIILHLLFVSKCSEAFIGYFKIFNLHRECQVYTHR